MDTDYDSVAIETNNESVDTNLKARPSPVASQSDKLKLVKPPRRPSTPKDGEPELYLELDDLGNKSGPKRKESHVTVAVRNATAGRPGEVLKHPSVHPNTVTAGFRIRYSLHPQLPISNGCKMWLPAVRNSAHRVDSRVFP